MAPKPLIALELGTRKGSSEKSGRPTLGRPRPTRSRKCSTPAKRGDFEAAAMAFHDAYEACGSSTADDDEDSDPFASDIEDEE